MRWLASLLVVVVLAGCMTAGDINDGFRRIDRVWQLEYQQTEDEYRYRAVDASYETVLPAVRKAFIDLGMPVQGSSLTTGTVIAENTAPSPLSPAEWQQIASAENPRLKEVAGPIFVLTDEPHDYIVTVKATVRPIKGRTLVLLDYFLDNPKIRRAGMEPSRHAPAMAVRLASAKFWVVLEKRLSEVKSPAPRRRTKQELEA